MSLHRDVRRWLLKVLAALPVGVVLGCGRGPDEKFDVQEAVQILMARLGPFPENRPEEIADLSTRYLESPAGKKLIADGSDLLLRIAGQLSRGSDQLATLNLRAFSALERQWLLDFVRQLYSFLEIRNRVCGEPIFGECQADPLFYTRLD